MADYATFLVAVRAAHGLDHGHHAAVLFADLFDTLVTGHTALVFGTGRALNRHANTRNERMNVFLMIMTVPREMQFFILMRAWFRLVNP